MDSPETSQPKRSKLFRVRPGHIVLAAATVSMMLSLAIWSWFSMQAHELETREIFAQESDSAAMTFVQRESFSVLLKIEQWADNRTSAREVQISRAMLGQRLGVQTRSDKKTFELVSPEYRAALLNLDLFLLEVGKFKPSERMAARVAQDKQIEEFSRQTRDLSDTFQELTRAQTKAAAEQRAQAELIQAIILMLIMCTGGALSTWITFDIVRGFRRVSQVLKEKQRNVSQAHERLLLVQNMDEQSRALIQAVHAGMPTTDVIQKLTMTLNELIPDNNLVIEIEGDELTRFSMRNPVLMSISDRDFGFLSARAEEVVRTALVRDKQKTDVEFAIGHDNLTRLANRVTYTAIVDEKAREVQEQGGVLGIVYFDIDRFGELNSSLGYKNGDQVLLNLANRLSKSLLQDEAAARLSSDEFAVVGKYSSQVEARTRALTLQSVLNCTLTLEGISVAVSVSVGCASSQVGHADSGELPHCAALAIHLAKKLDQRSSFVTYSPEDHAHLMTTWQEEIAVRNALATGEFKVFYQPILALDPLKPVGFEALIRWQRPGVGLVFPNDFLPIVNNAGLAVAVGADVISESLRTWAQVLQPSFAAAGLSDPYISINVEAIQLQDDSFADFLLAEVQQAGVPNHHVQLEITENALVGGHNVIAQLERLRNSGVRIALDDFGTGYSNLGQTLNLPLDVLKIDKSLLDNIEFDSKVLRMVDDVTKMAKGQDLRVTAEGIETEAAANLLREINVDYGQGYLFAKAMPASDVATWVDSQST